ncbi:hypothetical protein CANARDRAFT_199994 [[Candida] arabinofermentans NRRL YB-2248]|uniref:Mitochondrial distribution and morphology protein 34 n=1 Tax=[Candida] arabinofermentans NRRL YB-2248 TaxID=983967 RepID=A0A1E4T065_9ASCO|nr:hypothetical protein CANARDRAFT_199994 [[Candida] arabinofermentans NRRL YB-2248]
MSFKINWNAIEKQSLSSYTTELLNEALNVGKRPNILSSDIKIVDLNFGNIAPDFEILEIGDLGPDRFRGIFKFKYYGDAYITVNTKVSASPLKIYNDNILDELNEKKNSDFANSEEVADFITPNFNVSDCDFDIPLNLTLSKFKLSSIIIIVFSKTKGLTLVFKNDPLESIEVSSTFDRIKPIAQFLQKKIETQISELFKEFLPSLLYKFSLKYTTQSFDQFHKDLLNEEQDLEDKRVLLKDLDPEQPLRISPGSLMRLTRLSSSRQTLALGGKLSCDRMNDYIVTKTFANAILASTNTFNLNKIQLSNADFQYGSIGTKLSIIKNFQTRSFLKNSYDGSKPKRRTIKIGMKSRNKKNVASSTDEDSTSQSNVSTASTVVDQQLTSTPIISKSAPTSPLLFNKSTKKSSSEIYKDQMMYSTKNGYHIDKSEQLKIKNRRLKLDKLITGSPHHLPTTNLVVEAPPPYTL